MKILISGQNQSEGLGEEVRRAGRILEFGDPAQAMTPEIRLLAWQQTGSQAEYEAWVKRLLQFSAGSEVVEMPSAIRPGRLGATFLRVRVLIRKLMKGWLHGQRPPDVSSDIGALSLRQATSESDYTERLIQLMKRRDNLDSFPFIMPRKPGFAGAVMARLRIFLWQLLRFVVDRIAFRQNHINTMLTRALEYEHEQRKRENEALTKRLAELEARLAKASGNHGS